MWRSNSPTFTVASLNPSNPLKTVKLTSSKVSPVIHSYAVLVAASITPPVLPNITPAPVYSPNGLSNLESSNKF